MEDPKKEYVDAVTQRANVILYDTREFVHVLRGHAATVGVKRYMVGDRASVGAVLLWLVPTAACLAIEFLAGWTGEGFAVPVVTALAGVLGLVASYCEDYLGRQSRWVFRRWGQLSTYPVMGSLLLLLDEQYQKLRDLKVDRSALRALRAQRLLAAQWSRDERVALSAITAVLEAKGKVLPADRVESVISASARRNDAFAQEAAGLSESDLQVLVDASAMVMTLRDRVVLLAAEVQEFVEMESRRSVQRAERERLEAALRYKEEQEAKFRSQLPQLDMEVAPSGLRSLMEERRAVLAAEDVVLEGYARRLAE